MHKKLFVRPFIFFQEGITVMKQQEEEEKRYRDFLRALVQQVTELVPEGASVRTRQIRRINGCVIDGLQIRSSDSTLSPTVYVRQYFAQYQSGSTIRELAENICRICLDAKSVPELSPDYFRNYANLKGTIVYKIINYESNRELLAGIPHFRMLDLAAVYYCLIDRDAYFTSFVIRNQDLNAWGIPEAKLFREAAVNTPRLLPPRICPMNEILRGMMEEHIHSLQIGEEEDEAGRDRFLCEEQAEFLSEVDDEVPEIYVLTNEAKIQGAACMFYDNVLQEFAEKSGSNLIVIPSSVHEVLLLPDREFGYSANTYRRGDLMRDLDEMVRDVNRSEVAPDEVLSDHVYFYDRYQHRLSL
jgi:hypothetical protein